MPLEDLRGDGFGVMEYVYEEFGTLITRHRQDLKATHDAYGKRIAEEALKYGLNWPAVSRSALGRWFKGHRPCAFNTILLANLMGIPPASLGALIGRDLSEAEVRRTVTLHGGDPDHLQRTATMAPSDGAAPVPATADPTQGIDWERIGATMRSLRPVDGRIVADQWKLTREYVRSVPRMRPRAMLDLLSNHVTRLTHLSRLARDDHLRHQLDLMTAQTAVCAGILWTGLTDYGLAMEAYRYCVELAREMSESGLRSTGLIMQAQLYGGNLEPRLALSRSKVSNLIAEAEASADLEASPSARMFLHCHVSSLHALLKNETAAGRAMELARRAEAQIEPGSDPYFAATTPDYCAVHEGALALAQGQPARAIELYSDVITRTDSAAQGTLAWFKWTLATACVSAREPQLAAPTAWEAWRLARAVDAPFLVRGVETVAETLFAGYDREPAVRELRDQLRSEGEKDA
jgi:hypothetical protein